MATEPTNLTNLTNTEFDSLPEHQQDAITASPPKNSDESSVKSFFDGDGGTGEVSTEELDRRRAEGLTKPFDDDDDDLDEDLRPTAEADHDDTKPRRQEKAEDEAAETDSQATVEAAKAAKEKDATAKDATADTIEADPAAGDEATRAALVEAAQRYGLDVERFPTTEALEASVAAMDRMFHDIGAAEFERTAPPRPGTPGRGVGGEGRGEGPGERPGEAPSAEFPFDKLSKLDRLDRSEYAPELIDALDEMKAVIAELRSENQSERQRRVDAANEAAEREIDSFFAEIAHDNPVWSETFGTAPAGELLRTTEGRKLFENRMNVLRARDNYAAGLESRRQPTPASKKLLESGLALAFREKLGEAAERKLARKLQGRHSGAPPRPTQRQSPRREGSTALREALKRHGMQSDES